MSTSRYAVVRRFSRIFVLPLHGHITTNIRMRRRQGKDPTSSDDQRICTKENCLKCCKKFAAFMFSRVGLFFVMMGYVALGGVLFQALEAGNERNMRRDMEDKLNITLNKLWNEVLRVNSFSEKDKKGNFSINATNELEEFEKTVIRQVQQGFDGRTADAEHDWNYFGAVLYAVTLVSTIGYGHITTKTTQGKIATILYSAFGVPLMMLFVANIGSTMAKMFAFVFSRITMIFCCRINNKKKQTLILKNRQKLIEKNNIINEQIITKSNLKIIKDSIDPSLNSISMTSSITDMNLSNDLRELPADVRLNMLTGISNSLTSSRNSIGEKSKDAIVRINELIRQNSLQHIEDDNNNNDEQIRRRSIDINPIQYYINETNKLTSNLDSPLQDSSIISTEKDENNMKQVILPENTSKTSDDNNTPKQTKKSMKKNLKRSKSESSHNHRSIKPLSNNNESSNIITKPSTRRRFFSRKNDKLKKEIAIETTENNQNSLHRQTSVVEIRQINEKLLSKSQSFNEHSFPTLSPPNYEQSKINEITSLTSPPPTTVTWKGEHEVYPTTNTTIDLTNPNFNSDDEDFDEDEEMSVPLLVTVFVIPLYLTLGAILFSIWENWSFLDSFYFCFITLTTIGFGDYVPGSALKVEAEKEKLISAAVYILFGLVLIAMCINLMKEQLSQKVKRLASKLGKF